MLEGLRNSSVRRGMSISTTSPTMKSDVSNRTSRLLGNTPKSSMFPSIISSETSRIKLRGDGVAKEIPAAVVLPEEEAAEEEVKEEK